MKIALFVPSWPPGGLANGIVSYASQLVPELRRLGHEVFVITPSKMAGYNDPFTIDLREYMPAPTLWTRAAWKLVPDLTAYRTTSLAVVATIRELLVKHGIDIFQIEDTFGWGLEISRLKLLPVVIRLHGPWFLNGQFENNQKVSGNSQRRIRREGIAIAAATAITAPSNNVLNSTAKYYKIDFKLAKAIPNAIGPVGQDRLWNAASADRNSLFYVGRFDRHKGADILLNAFARLAEQFPMLRLSFVGPDVGLTTNGGSVQKLRDFTNGPAFDNARNRIDYLGTLSREAIQKLRPSSYITIVSSRYETFSNAVIEAMASGCPLVATAVGGIAEIVEDGRNGLLVASQDIKGMALACRRLLDDPEMATRLGQQALQDCRDRYNPGKIAKETVALYQNAINVFLASQKS